MLRLAGQYPEAIKHLSQLMMVASDDPRVVGLVRDGNPIYAWPFEERHVWRSRHMAFAARVLERVTRPSGNSRVK